MYLLGCCLGERVYFEGGDMFRGPGGVLHS